MGEEYAYMSSTTGPDANERGIEDLYASYKTPPVAGDEYWAKMNDGTIFLDWDEDNYYDDAFRYGDGGIWEWDTTTNDWVWHQFPPDEPGNTPKNTDNN
jgi:hypothetical protein